jgi:leucyl aminopeptidase
MTQTSLPIETPDSASRPIFAVRPGGIEGLLARLEAPQAAFVRAAGFAGKADELVLLPGGDGVTGAVFGLGKQGAPQVFGGLPFKLPEGVWRLEPGDFDAEAAVLGFCLGAYRYSEFKKPGRAPARLATGHGGRALSQAAAIWMVRDLINAPANVLGPVELADATVALGAAHGAGVFRSSGAELDAQYPTIAAVGRGSERAAQVAGFHWQGSGAGSDAPHVWLCGKGVCFDSGGYDLKPSAAMLRMKKDMGGAANILGLAAMIMDADLPLRLSVSIGCVENSVSGRAMRPMDVLRTRRGLTVEIGNTDAEGRLVLCDLLAEASDAGPALIVDCATLTGAARVAIGPDMPALFANDEAMAAAVLAAGGATHDPLWRLPLWDGYNHWLDSAVADLNNVSSKPFAGAVVAGLFLQRFVAGNTPWIHLDMYAWNDATRPGRPEGGEAMGIRALFSAIELHFCRV